MLIQDYSLQIYRCNECGGSFSKLADNCGYCGAPATSVREIGVFSRDVRVLSCADCGAPLPVPISGGHVTCEYCQTEFDIVARRERKLGTGRDKDDPRRIERLREQDRKGPRIPSSLVHLIKDRQIADSTAEEATRMWKDLRRRIRGRTTGEREEKELYFLTEMLADYHSVRGRVLQSRTLLETAVELLEAPEYLQGIYSGISRKALKLGDWSAAEEWLAMCDPYPEKLIMDTTVRVTWADICLRREDYQGVLLSLGEDRFSVPLLDSYDDMAELRRAHAIGKLRGNEEAVDYIVQNTPPTFTDWRHRINMVKNSGERRLGADWIENAVRIQWTWRRPFRLCAIFFAVAALLILDTLGPRVLGVAIYPIGVLWTLAMGGFCLVLIIRRQVLYRMAKMAAKT